MEYLPNLTELKLSPFRSNGPDDSILTLDSERGKKFLNYLNRIVRFEVQEQKECARASRFHEWQGHEPFSPGSHSVQDENFWRYVHALLGEGYRCDLLIRTGTSVADWPLVISADRKSKTVLIENVWVTTICPRADWIDATLFLTFRHVTIQGMFGYRYNDPLFSLGYASFIRLMKANKTGNILVKNMVEHRSTQMLLNFVGTYTFARQAKIHGQQPQMVVYQGQKRKRDSVAIKQELDVMIRDRMIESMKLYTVGERLLEISHSIHDIEYLVE
jgi:hypothetical protein